MHPGELLVEVPLMVSRPPSRLPGAVILDATANNDVLYQLLEDRVYVAAIPPNVRNYCNVTLHVARTSSGLGKSITEDTKHLRLPRLAKHLSEEIAPGRSVFLCVHKHSEALAETFSTDKLKLNVGHWGAIDGKNTWKDCDVAVIYGLPYMDQRRAINNLFATHGPQDTAWLQANTHKQHATLVNVIMQRHLSTSVVQAINRICCRRVIDEHGRCPVSDVYILLPKNWQGDAILSDIQANMPGIGNDEDVLKATVSHDLHVGCSKPRKFCLTRASEQRKQRKPKSGVTLSTGRQFALREQRRVKHQLQFRNFKRRAFRLIFVHSHLVERITPRDVLGNYAIMVPPNCYGLHGT